MYITLLLYGIERWERVHSITGDEEIVNEQLPPMQPNRDVMVLCMTS
jgi:hypothetical protein